MSKKTVVIGATDNPERYAYAAVRSLQQRKIPVVAVGLKEGWIGETKIHKGQPPVDDVDTVTMYVGARNQPPLYDYILSLKPRRIIFNPGAENPDFEKECAENHIEVLHACTLTMLSIGNY